MLDIHSSVMFTGGMVLVVLVALAWKVPFKTWPEYFKTRTGLGILKGVVIVVCLGAAIALLSGCSTGSYVNDASIYAGLDYTSKTSPQCVSGNADDLTSNVGAKLNLYESEDGKFRTNSKYTHHSCA